MNLKSAMQSLIQTIRTRTQPPARRRKLATALNVAGCLETLEVRRLLSATVVEDQRTNNTMGTATNIGDVRNNRHQTNGSVGGSDPVDFYRFQPQTNGFALTGNISTVIELKGHSRDLDVYVYNAAGRQIASSTRSGTTFESLKLNLAQGSTYFIKVVPYGSGSVSSYQLDVSTENSNDTLTQATNLGSVRSTTSTTRGTVGSAADPVDYYRFSPTINGFALTGRIQTTIRLSGMSRDVDVYVLDSSGREIGRSNRSGTADESLTLTVSQGSEYFIKVVPYGSSTMNSDYRLTIST